jgi:hypothetical protein
MLAVTKQARPHDRFSFPWIYEYTDLCQKAHPHDQFSFPWIYEYTDLCHFLLHQIAIQFLILTKPVFIDMDMVDD